MSATSPPFAYQPGFFKVTAVDSDHFVTRYSDWLNAGNVSKVMICSFNIPGAGEVISYAKAVNLDDPADRIMCLNEITGWLLAEASGLPVAERAFIGAIPTADIPQGLAPDGRWLFFCTQQISESHAAGECSNLELEFPPFDGHFH